MLCGFQSLSGALCTGVDVASAAAAALGLHRSLLQSVLEEVRDCTENPEALEKPAQVLHQPNLNNDFFVETN